MSYDYGKDKNKKKPVKKNQKTGGRPAIPGWILFFSGVAFTLFGQFLFHLTQVDTPAQTTNPDATAVTEEPAHKKPTINFYNQLKTMEVKVPADETITPAAATTPQPAVESATQAISDTANTTIESQTVQKPPQQFLQAGSYTSAADADEQRAALSLLGIKSGMETKANADGTTYYRVMVGPFASATELEKARSTLNSNNVPTITVKR